MSSRGPRRALGLGARWAALAVCAGAVAGSVQAAGGGGPADDLLDQLNGTGQGSASQRHAEYLRQLRAAEASISECRQFLGRFGDRPQVKAALRRIRAQPGEQFFTESGDIDALAQAVGGNLSLTQQDLELCVRARDGGLGDPAGQDAASFAAIGASLGKCIAALVAVGPDPEGVAVLGRASRRPADPTFTSAQTLAALERAVGDLPLTARDLETCVDAFHQNATLEPPPDACAECVGAGGVIECCPTGQVCNQSTSPGTYGTCVFPSGCFPATATLRLEDGSTKAMPDVRLGDRVQVARADGTLGYEEVYLNTHKDRSAAAPYVALTLASGRTLILSPRHFIPVAADTRAAWDGRVTKGADEVAPGDLVWSRSDDGRMTLDEVAAAETRVAVGAYNPLTMNGTIVVDGVVASAHSDWFLDGLVPADTEAKVYQAVLAPCAPPTA